MTESKSPGSMVGMLAACTLAAACAISEPSSNNGQSHWLQPCERDADCDGLKCLCGVCAPTCPEGRSSVGMSVQPDPIEQRPTDSPAADPVNVDCDAIETETLPRAIERVGGDGWINGLAASGTAISWADESGLHHRYDDRSADIETFTRDAYNPLHDGYEIVFVYTPPTNAPSIAKISLADRKVMSLAQEPVAQITAFAVDRIAVYWASHLGQGDTVTLWRSSRTGGETEVLAMHDGISPYFIYPIDDWLYFPIGIGSGGESVYLYRLRKDGSDRPELIGDSIANLSTLVGDANGLFGLISSDDGWIGPPIRHRVVRIDTSDGRVDTLFETQRALTAAIDADHIYWIAKLDSNNSSVGIWRGRRDGRGNPVQLVEGWPYEGGFGGVTVSDAWIYFKADCESGSHLLRLPKPGA